jgi:hypothetical protein
VRPLTPDDLLPLAEFCARRAELAEAHRAYCDRYRRVRLGPSLELLFENRQTLWFRAQELLRVMHNEDATIIRTELDACSRLLPRRHRVLAGLLAAEARVDSANIKISSIEAHGRVLPLRPEDRALGVAAWIEFAFSAAERDRFADFSSAASIELILSGKRHDSGALADEVRQSLIDDLKMSEREAA